MRVFVAGATGALGRQLVPGLVAAGHEVVGMTRTAAKQEALGAMGARPVVADALDPDAVARVVAEAEPGGDRPPAHRAVGSAGPAAPGSLLRHDQPPAHRGHRLPAGRRPGGGRAPLRGAELCGLAVRPRRRAGQGRDRPLDPDLPRALRTTLAAIRHLEQAVTGIGWGEGLVLRYGGFYGRGPR